MKTHMPEGMRKIMNGRLLTAVPFALVLLAASPAGAKTIEEAFHDMAVVQGDDPNGFTLMIVSVVLLMTMATTLMVITGMYMYKPRLKEEEVQSDDSAS